jgi:hypothetical protein
MEKDDIFHIITMESAEAVCQDKFKSSISTSKNANLIVLNQGLVKRRISGQSSS